jgi:hypothetical protein
LLHAVVAVGAKGPGKCTACRIVARDRAVCVWRVEVAKLRGDLGVRRGERGEGKRCGSAEG